MKNLTVESEIDVETWIVFKYRPRTANFQMFTDLQQIVTIDMENFNGL